MIYFVHLNDQIYIFLINHNTALIKSVGLISHNQINTIKSTNTDIWHAVHTPSVPYQLVCFSCKIGYAKASESVDSNKLWKILKEMGIPGHLTCLLRNLYAGQEETVRTRHEATDSFQIVKGVLQGCILSPCLFNLCTEYIMWHAGLDDVQAGIKNTEENINNLRYADDTTLMAESEEELKSLWMKVKEENEKVGLKLNIQKTKVMASGPITSWQTDGKTVETVRDFIFLGSKITADGDCNHEIKRRLLLGRKSMTNLDSILKSRDITLSTKVCLVKAMVFLVVMYGCESWTIKKAERWRIDAFELWCWRRLESPLDCKVIKPVNPKGNQPRIFIGRTDAEAPILLSSNEGTDSLEKKKKKNPDARKDWEQEEKGVTEDDMVGWHHQLNGYEFEQTLGDSEEQGSLACCNHGVAKSQKRLSCWTTTASQIS